MKKIIILFAFIFILFSLAIVLAQGNSTNSGETNAQSNPPDSDSSTSSDSSPVVIAETTSNQETSENKDAGQKISEEQVELKAEPGMTPDNPVYFVKDIYQRITVGNDPEKALDYKEQKIAEAEVMVEKGMPDQAEKVLDRALQYSDIVEKEASPEMKERVQESGAAVENTIKNMEEKTNGNEWKTVREKFDETIKKEKEVGTAAELAAKINELCASLAQLDPLQYADTCTSKSNSPKWMKEQDKQLTAEQEKQARDFFEKLSQCFESPENCDCKGMGVQKFEDFCLEKSKLALKCKQGDESACKESQSGDPTDLLPDYLVPILNQMQGKYTKAQYDMYMPEECVKQGAKNSEDCSKIMFKFDAPKECLDAGLTGKNKEDEIKCEKIMFDKNTPKECLDAGISSSDSDAPRKCSKIMFMQRAPKACIEAGITGEGRDDEKKCRQLTGGGNDTMGLGTNTISGGSANQQKFNRDCNKIQDSTEKMNCYQEFYNNAQVQFKEDFVQKEMIDSNTGEVITSGEENARKQCRDKGMDTILEYENGKRIIICVDKGKTGTSGGRCQSQDETEKLKQDCKTRGQNANVETRGGCPWVVCVGGNYKGDYSNEIGRVYAPGTGPNQNQQPSNGMNQQPSQNTGGVKCPDNVCDDYEKMNPWACPEDCGGTRQPGNNPQQQPGNYQPPQQQPSNNINQPQQPNQNQENFCSGQAPDCAPNGAPYCQNGNWVCPQAQQQQQPMQPQQPQQPQEQPQQPSQQEPTPNQQPPAQEPQQEQQQPQQPTGGSGVETTPVTSSVITGAAIASVYGNENSRDGDSFLNYWFKRLHI